MKILMGTKNSGKIEADFYVSSEAEITNQGFPILNKYIDEIKKLNWIFSGQELGKGKGGISFFTKNENKRIDLTRNAFIMALTGHINGEVWRWYI